MTPPTTPPVLNSHIEILNTAAILLRRWAGDRRVATGNWGDDEQAALACAIHLERMVDYLRDQTPQEGQ